MDSSYLPPAMALHSYSNMEYINVGRDSLLIVVQ